MSQPIVTAEEARVLGCLIEKQLTTPEYYPLTLLSLVAACNQKNNRQPVAGFDEKTVVRALDALRELKLAAQVSESGARVPKYRHTAAETLALDERGLAVLCELLVRGPQTVGELRNRAERMHPFADLAEVQTLLEELANRPEGGALTAKLPRQPGMKESRYAHLLCGPLPEAAAGAGPAGAPPEPARLAVQTENERLARLEQELAAQRTEIEALKEQLAQFRRQFE